MKDAPAQMPACDRCRGQKLRCFRSQDSQATCNRCERAGTTCSVDSSVRMGRPSRNQTNDQEQKKERRKHQRSFSNSPEGSIKRRNQRVKMVQDGIMSNIRGHFQRILRLAYSTMSRQTSTSRRTNTMFFLSIVGLDLTGRL
jgi:hypothetical protein